MTRGRAGAALLAVLAALVLLACSRGPGGGAAGAVRLGSTLDPENVVVAEILAQRLELAGYQVERVLERGSAPVVEELLVRGALDLAPVYLGPWLFRASGGQNAGWPDASLTAEALGRLLEADGVRLLPPAPGENSAGFVMTAARAEQLRARRLSDLSGRAQELVLAAPRECEVLPICAVGLQRQYGISFRQILVTDHAGPRTLDALLRGQADVAWFMTSAPEILQHGLVVLDDDRGMTPADNVAVAVRASVTQGDGGRLQRALEPVLRQLTTAELVRLNHARLVGGAAPRDIARAWLAEKELDRTPRS